MDELLTTRDLIKMLKLSARSLDDLVKEDGFPKPLMIGTRKRRYRQSDITAWLATR